MSTWRLVSGILSIVLSVFVFFQSGIAGLANTLSENGEVGGSAGIIVSICLLAGGITSIVTRKGGRAGSFAVVIIFGLAAFLGFVLAGSYGDLVIWSIWCLICAILGLISIIKSSKEEYE